MLVFKIDFKIGFHKTKKAETRSVLWLM